MQQNKGQKLEEEDNETSLTADGLITAIRRVLQSISGMFPELYPQLEQILEQSLFVTLTDEGESQIEEGLSCIAELIFNQSSVSERMWRFFGQIT